MAAVLIAGGCGFVAGRLVGNLRSRLHAEAALREARRETRELAALIDDWTWQTDAEHRLSRLQPPAGADAGQSSFEAALGSLLWERFESAPAAGATGLQARLQARVAFSGLRVREQAGTASCDWVLRATPRVDDLGGFDGFVGSVRPTGQTDLQRADQSALLALLATLDTPTLLAAGNGTPAGWRLRHANAAAQRLFDADTPAWNALLARLPTAVIEAVSGAIGGAAAIETAGWRVRRFDDCSGTGGWLLLLVQNPTSDSGGADDGQGGDAASFSFTLSHDLRAPIRVVEGFARILKEDYGRQIDRVGNDHLDRVLGAAARMNHMIDALLALAKLSQQPLARQPVDLSQLAAFVIDELRRAAPERAADVEIEPGLKVQGDPTLLRLVLENLLGNAWKYTARCKKANIVFAGDTQEGRRSYVVRDNGAGFDMRSADRLFGLFQRLHSANDFPGTGVGLASVKRIVRRHGGDVWADSEPGRGAAFHFTLRS